jgi:hypothetical protein
MPQNEARAWWADVEHVRESIERRRGDVVDATTADPAPTRRFARAAAAAAEPPVPRLEDLDWPPELPSGPGRRFEHSTAATPDGTAERARRHRAEAAADAAADRPRSRSRGAVDERVARRRTASRHAAGTADATTERASAALDYDLEREFMSPPPPPGVRRTVQITGRTVAAPSLPRLVEVERRRPGRRPAERVGPRPDRLALYAVLLGFFLILVAATSAHAGV